MLRKILLAAFLLQGFIAAAQTTTKAGILQNAATSHRQKEKQNLEKALALAKEKGWPVTFTTKPGGTAHLVGVDEQGFPVYYAADNNTVAAATTGANLLWNGGSSGLNLSGASASVKDKLAIWDGGGVLGTHVELANRVIQRDAGGISDHATHVAGTMIASGVNPLAKGMAYGLQRLVAYDFASDGSEMMGEAQNLLLSNHSYGTVSGWTQNSSQNNRWEFRGRAGENEDYKFGYYDTRAQLLDSIAYNAPYYLIVKSAGNNRNVNGPAVGQPYYRYDASGNMVDAGPRPLGISSNDGYDIIATYGTAKNILTVGAIRGLPLGYSRKEDAVISSFSSWGPTDDGRIKPDVVADGVDVLSSTASSSSSYASYSGTSMASPNASGSLLLLQEYYNQLHPDTFMRSATLKALIIHTASEAGPARGPDYQFGWGVINVAKAAEVIKAKNNGAHRLFENVLNNGQSFSTTVIASGQGSLSATIAWTDPKGSVEFVNMLNNKTKKLVNDLDIRITKGTTTYRPWTLDPSVPMVPAMVGDNELDNVERIDIDDVIPGETYTITITHKGTLERGSQAYSLIMSGVGGQAYCTSAATASSGTRIDSVAFGGIRNQNAAGCTTYRNFTNLSTTIEPGQNLPLYVKVGSCDASTTSKIVKVFIDYNSNGSFADAGELVATSHVISGSGTFATAISIPAVVNGNAAIMRVVAQDASTASEVNACGAYTNGETQDYRLLFAASSNDLSLREAALSGNNCATSNTYLTVKVRNNGTMPKTNLALNASVTTGSTTVATLTGVYPPSADAGSIVTYTFQTPFATQPGTTYNIAAYVTDATDQNRSNDTLRTTLTTAAPATPAGDARICGPVAMLRVTNPAANANYFWYSSPGTDNPITGGAPTSTTVIPASNTYYLTTGAAGNIGLASNTVYPNGGGYLTSNSANYMNFTATVPAVLQTARLYVKYPGKVEFMVADVFPNANGGYSYQTISSTTIDVYATTPNEVPGAHASFDAQDTGAVFAINLPLPVGNHAIIVRPQGNTNLFRNNNVPATENLYPFSLPGVISFTGNNASVPANYYYYMYNMRISTDACTSPKATVVASVAPTPVISQLNDTLVSSIDSNNQWLLNGSYIAGATEKRYKPTQTGNYTVLTTDSYNCQRISAAFNFTATAINPVDNAEVAMKLAPNPTSGDFTISFKMATRADLKIELINVGGQPVMTKTYPKFSGSFAQTFSQPQLASGVYMLRIQHGTKVYYNKLLVQR